MTKQQNTPQPANGDFAFNPAGEVVIREAAGNQTREPWLMLLARRGQELTKTLCWGLTSTGSSFARIGTQESDLINGFVHEDPYKAAPLGQYVYLVDQAGDFCSATWYPLCRPDQSLETTFGFGSVNYRSGLPGLETSLDCFVADHCDAMVQILRVRNSGSGPRRLKLFSLVPVNIGDARSIGFSGFNTLMLGGAYVDRELGATVYRNNFGVDLDEGGADDGELNGLFSRVLVHAASQAPTGYGTRYEDFIGHHSNGLQRPAGLFAASLPDRDSQDGCSNLSTLRVELSLEAGEERDLVFVCLAADSRDYFLRGKAGTKKLLDGLLEPSRARALLAAVRSGWQRELEQLAFHLPAWPLVGPSIRWLHYQCRMVTLLNRMKSRFHSGFEYGFGFRDILQDILVLLPAEPAAFKSILPWVAGQMFSDGSVYHNFFASAPGNKAFEASDDPLWYVYALCEYVQETSDVSLLDAVAPYADEKENLPARQGSLLDHLYTAIERVWGNGEAGLPRLLDADWNDDLSDYHDHLSVLCAMQLHKALLDAAGLLEATGRDPGRARLYRDRAGVTANSLLSRAALADGSFIRALATKPGQSDLGSPAVDGQTFFEPLAWAGFAGVVDAEGFRAVKAVVEARLSDRYGIVICQGDLNLVQGRIPPDWAAWKRSAPGKKENGGEFRHLESWYIASLCRFGYGREAWELYYCTLPAVCSADDPFRYGAERFVFPEYVSGPASYEYGRAGHTWLTGTAPTRLGVLLEWILGLRRSYRGLEIDPCVHPDWREWSARRRWRGTDFSFSFRKPAGLQKGTASVRIDGRLQPAAWIDPLWCDGGAHTVEVELA